MTSTLQYAGTEQSTKDRNHLLKHAFDIAGLKDGDVVLEFGVRSGTSLKWMAEEIIKRNLQVWLLGFDSFEGLPEETQGVWNHPKHAFGAMAVAQSRVQSILPNDERIELVPGWFQYTLHPELVKEITEWGSIKLVNIDVDLHSSTTTILDALNGHLTGALLHFDDWWENDGRPPWGEKLAWNQFIERNPEVNYELLHTCDHGRRIIEVL